MRTTATVVFAETRNKTRIAAQSTNACEDLPYLEINPRRVPACDKYYKPGKKELEWEEPAERFALVYYCNFQCDPDTACEGETCSAAITCERKDEEEGRMTDLDALKRYLKEYDSLRGHYDEINRRAAKIRDELTSLAGLNYDGRPRARNVTDGKDKTAALLDEIHEIEIALNAAKLGAAKKYRAIEKTIALLDYGETRRALELRYLDRLSADEIGNALGYSEATAWRRLEEGIRELLKINAVKKIVKAYKEENR